MRTPAINPSEALTQFSRANEPIAAIAFSKAQRALEIFQAANTPPPFVFPTDIGGIQFEWHGAERELDIEVLPEGELFAYAVFEDGQSKREGEDAKEQDLLALLNWIR